MKKFMTITFALLSLITIQAQNKQNNKNEQKEKLDVIYHNNALISLQDSTFVLEADRVIFKRGRSVYVNPTSNFISLNKTLESYRPVSIFLQVDLMVWEA